MIESRTTIEINGSQFLAIPYTPPVAFKIQGIIARKILPGITKAYSNISLDKEIDFDAISEGLSAITSHMGEDELYNDIKLFLSNVFYDDAPVNEDRNMSKVISTIGYVNLYKLVFKVVKYNFPDFFGLKELLPNSGSSETITKRKYTKRKR